MTKQSHLRLVRDEDDFSADIFAKFLEPEPGKKLTWQTIPIKGAKGAAQILQGTFYECREQLEMWNNRDHNIYVSVNETDLKGRKQGNIIRARAVVQDDDKGVGWKLPIPPSFEVETSPGRFHRWLLIADDVSLDEWDSLHAAMIHRWGSDPNLKGRQSILRVPTFRNHNYPDSPIVRLSDWQHPVRRYTRDELVAAVQPMPVTPTGPAEPLEPTASDRTPLCKLDLAHNVKRMQEYIDGRPVIHVGDGLNNALYPHAAMFKDWGISSERGWPMIETWLEKCGCTDRPKSLATFERAYAGGNRPGCKTAEAIDHDEGLVPIGDPTGISSTPAKPATSDSSVESRCLADIEREPVSWLWHNRIALGKVAQIAGEPKRGKSQITCAMTAAVTTGGLWPDGARAPLGSVIIISCEDDMADTVGPRCDAAGADSRRIHTLDWVLGRDPKKADGGIKQLHFDVGQHTPALRQLITRLGDVKMIIIDPISAYMGKANSHITAEVRSALAPIAIMAAEFKIAVVLVAHLNKNIADKAAANRVGGSGAFVAVARSNWLVAHDPEDETKKRRLMAPIGSNIGDDSVGFAFTIEGVELPGGITTSKVVFERDPIKMDADDILSGPPKADSPKEIEKAVEFLRKELATGPKLQPALMEAAQAEGISERTLRRAKKQLGVRSRKTPAGWEWLYSDPDEGHEPIDPPADLAAKVAAEPVAAKPEYDFG